MAQVTQLDIAMGVPISGGFRFPEGSRWHEGSLYVSDMHSGEVWSIDPDSGEKTLWMTVDPRGASGSGWLPDGRMLVVSMHDRKVMRREDDGSVVVHADLSTHTPWPINDMLVTPEGVAFVGAFGYDLYGGAEVLPSPLYRVFPDGTIEHAAEDLTMANGAVLLPGDDGGYLYVVAETWSAQLTAFELTPEHQLIDRRLWAEVPGATPDGITTAGDGAIWISSIITNEFIRVLEGGKATHRISTGERLAIDCAHGGQDGRTLFLLTADTYVPEETATNASGSIVAFDLDLVVGSGRGGGSYSD